MVGKTAENLWQDYQFLTKEMLKFLSKQDMELFYNLMNQREQLQIIIDQTDDCGFKVSSAGQSLLAGIQQDNQYISDNLQLRLNSSKRLHQVSVAYSVASTTAVSQINLER